MFGPGNIVVARMAMPGYSGVVQDGDMRTEAIGQLPWTFFDEAHTHCAQAHNRQVDSRAGMEESLNGVYKICINLMLAFCYDSALNPSQVINIHRTGGRPCR